MSIHQDLLKAVQHDAQRSGERDRLLLEARRARVARRLRAGPATPGEAAGPAAVSRRHRITEEETVKSSG